MSCKRSDAGLLKLNKYLILTNNSEPKNTTEQFDSSHMASPEFSDNTESGNTWKFEGTTESGKTSKFEDTTESSNASKSEDAHGKGRSVLIAPAGSSTEPKQPTEGKVLIDCRNKKTTCVTVSCSLYGPIKSMFKAYVSFRMSATIEDLGEFPCPHRVGMVPLLLTHTQ